MGFHKIILETDVLAVILKVNGKSVGHDLLHLILVDIVELSSYFQSFKLSCETLLLTWRLEFFLG